MRGAAALALCLLTADHPPAAPSACPGPRPGWLTPRDGLPHLTVVNRLRVTRGNRLEWNRVPVTRDTVRGYLGLVGNMRPLPFTILAPDRDADCAFLEAIRDDMAAELPCNEGGCGEGRGRWGDGDVQRPLTPEAESERANIVAEIEAAADAAAAAVEPKHR
ncbi:MAG TPA: hypothetical protein VEX35_11140 [Allosphingosinicella sp.]|nr:hypothetical protein [Allosphingosinicella sp.]